MRGVLWLMLLAGCADDAAISADGGSPLDAAVADAGAPLDAAVDAAPDATPADATVDATVDADSAPDYAGLEPAAVRGTVYIFGPGGRLADAEIFVLEHPEIRTRSDARGRFTLAEVPPGPVTLVMLADGYHENQLGTHELLGEDLEGFDFQAVPDQIFVIFGRLGGAEADPTRCQVSTTVTRWFEASLPAVHGEPGATATIDPPVTEPVYFSEQVLPTPGLTETTVDGGVAWLNVPPGDYVLRAHKAGVAFEAVQVHCRAGVLVNAGPPRGLQALNPGSGY